MALDTSAIIARARLQLQDVISGAYRWTDAELTYWVVDGSIEIGRLKPEAITDYQSSPTAASIPSGASSINSLYGTALVDYVCYRALSKDGEDGEAQVAGRYLQSFYAGLGMRKSGG